MLDATLTFHHTTELPEPPLALRLPDGSGTFGFDAAEYDDASDRLRLTAGPPSAASAELTPEGHVLRISAPDGRLCGVVLTDVRRRLLRDGRVDVTLGPDQRVELDAGELAHLLTGHPRSRRFARI